MARSTYFSQHPRSEQVLYEDIIIESIKTYGVDTFYLPRRIVSLDRILNEDTESRFEDAFDIEMYIESAEGYEGDGILMSKFGLEIRNQLKVIVSKRRWNTAVGKWNKGFMNYRPAEGDLIYIPYVRGLFEIKYVDLETPFHQLNNLPVYKMTLELFEYRGEDMNTGVEDIDRIQDIKSKDSSYRVGITYTSASTFNIHESVNLSWASGANGTARVTAFLPQTDSSMVIQLSALRFTNGTIHALGNGTTITGQSTGTTATITRLITLTDGDEALNDGDFSIQNNPIETRANAIIDFTTRNPFGESNDA